MRNHRLHAAHARSVLFLVFALALVSCSANRYASIRQDLENGAYEAAIERLEDTSPRDAHYNALLAEASYHLGDYDTFLDALSRSLRQGDEFRDDLLYLMTLADIELSHVAHARFDEGDYAGARATIDVILRVRYLHDWVRKPLGFRALSTNALLEYSGEALVMEGRFDEASTRLVFLARDSLRNLNSKERLAYVYLEMQRFDRVNRLLIDLMSPSEDREAVSLLSEELELNDFRTDSVLADYIGLAKTRQLVERPLVDSHLGVSFYERDRWDQSRFRFEEVLKTEPGNPVEFLALIGESYFLEAKYDSAAAAFRRALAFDDDLNVLEYLALTEIELGNKAKADSLYQIARERMKMMDYAGEGMP